MVAVSALMDYSELQLNFLRFRLRELEKGHMCVELQHDGVPRLKRHVVEHLLANIVTLATTQIGYQLPELSIELAHGDANDAAHLAEVLNADVSFDCPAYRLESSRAFGEQQGRFGEEDLYRVTEELARQRLMTLRGEDRFLNKVRATVLQQLPGGLPKVEEVARSLDSSARTLQRRLQERNLRFQQVLDEVRSELALQLIRDNDLSLNEVADYLGFNDQSALQHAFRRWQGMTPGQYRKKFMQ
jgi:AraC-like DNA-binding protein